MKLFKDLGLSEKSLVALEKKGFEEPTEIQELTIPLMLENTHDIIAQAQTGTGKTAAFALPLIERIDPKDKRVKAIILAPTRELVIQICEETNSLKGEHNISVAPIYGGQSIDMQLRKLRQGVNIVVGTPGRIMDHIRRKTLKLQDIEYFVLDEADEMLNMGFVDDIEEILEYTPEEKRVLLFSATMPNRIKNLAEKYMGGYKHLKTKTNLTTNLTEQIYFEVSRRNKFEALSRIIDVEENFYGIIFCRTKNDVDEVASQLVERGYSADALHGDISQAQREKVLTKFRKKQLIILVATDVAARGIDVDNISHVINYSIPQNAEAYVHRIGRTGRAGNQGTAITFITSAEFRKLGFIKKTVKSEIKKAKVPEVKDIVEAKKVKIVTEVQEIIDEKKMDDCISLAKELMKNNHPEEIIAAVLKQSYGNTLDHNSYKQFSSAKESKAQGIPEGQTRLFIAKGKADNMTKRELVDFIVDQAGIPHKMIDRLELYDTFSFITVPLREAEIILKKFKDIQQGNKSLVEKAKARSGGGDRGGDRGGRRHSNNRRGGRDRGGRGGDRGGRRRER